LKRSQKPLIAIIGGKKVESKSKVIDKISEKADWILINSLIRNEIKEKNIKLKYPQKIIEPIDEIEGKDIGPQTIDIFKEKINLAKTIFWSGPLGMIEKEKFSKGTEETAKAVIKSSVFSVVGGGDTVEFINKLNLASKFNHVSTGGGAMLAFLAGEKLPGLAALK
jgi:phosphoglycerate kinase